MATRPLAVPKTSPAAMKQLAVLAAPVLLLLLSLSLSLLLLLLTPTSPPPSPSSDAANLDRRLRVYVADLPRSLNYGLLERYWSLPAAPDHPAPHCHPPYPDSPLVKQYSAEYWLLASLPRTPAVRAVGDWREADVVFVPFFATLSAEMELGWGAKGAFRGKEGNHDYRRQREVVDRVTAHPAWWRSRPRLRPHR
jgi:hypothetical protein